MQKLLIFTMSIENIEKLEEMEVVFIGHLHLVFLKEFT